MTINNGPTLAEIGAAISKVPDDVLYARLRAIGFTVDDAGGPDHDQMEAAANQEDWWTGCGETTP